jgi:hypothetical protein
MVKEGSVALILDYRERQDRYIKFKAKSGVIDVIQFDPSSIVLG